MYLGRMVVTGGGPIQELITHKTQEMTQYSLWEEIKPSTGCTTTTGQLLDNGLFKQDCSGYRSAGRDAAGRDAAGSYQRRTVLFKVRFNYQCFIKKEDCQRDNEARNKKSNKIIIMEETHLWNFNFVQE